MASEFGRCFEQAVDIVTITYGLQSPRQLQHEMRLCRQHTEWVLAAVNYETDLLHEMTEAAALG